MVRTVASLLGQNGLAPGAPAAPGALGRPRWRSTERLASARRYQEGVSWAGVCFAAYNLVAFGFSFLLLALVKRSSARSIHLVCLALGGLGLLSVLVVRDPGACCSSRWSGSASPGRASSPCRTPCSRTPCPRRRWASTWASSTSSSCSRRSWPRSGFGWVMQRHLGQRRHEGAAARAAPRCSLAGAPRPAREEGGDGVAVIPRRRRSRGSGPRRRAGPPARPPPPPSRTPRPGPRTRPGSRAVVATRSPRPRLARDRHVPLDRRVQDVAGGPRSRARRGRSAFRPPAPRRTSGSTRRARRSAPLRS